MRTTVRAVHACRQQARDFTATSPGTADLSTTIAPASEISATGSPSVMAVAIGEGELTPDAVTEGTDWVGITADAKGAANELLDDACGPLPAPEPAGSAGSTPSEEPAPTAEPAPAAEASGAATVTDKNCGDVGSQAEAQDFFEDNGGPGSDEHGLDADDDGQACETHFGGDGASRAEARTINAGVPEGDGASPAGLAGAPCSSWQASPSDCAPVADEVLGPGAAPDAVSPSCDVPDADSGGRRDPG